MAPSLNISISDWYYQEKSCSGYQVNFDWWLSTFIQYFPRQVISWNVTKNCSTISFILLWNLNVNKVNIPSHRTIIIIDMGNKKWHLLIKFAAKLQRGLSSIFKYISMIFSCTNSSWKICLNVDINLFYNLLLQLGL